MKWATWRKVGYGVLIVVLLAIQVHLMIARSHDAKDATARPHGTGSPTDGTRVLFVGNSYTSFNDLPAQFAALAEAGGHRVYVERVAPGGWSLHDHAGSKATRAKIGSVPWDFVVLQEHSELPVSDRYRRNTMYPAARQLVDLARHQGARPVFFLTPAHRNGSVLGGVSTYAAMQSAIAEAYLEIAGEEHALIAPVGYAWARSAGAEPDPDLWQPDGSHPTSEGTYLDACVFYATIFEQSPVGLPYVGDLAPDTAGQYQRVAATTVLKDRAEWGLTPQS
jgi:hypothetical protein